MLNFMKIQRIELINLQLYSNSPLSPILSIKLEIIGYMIQNINLEHIIWKLELCIKYHNCDKNNCWNCWNLITNECFTIKKDITKYLLFLFGNLLNLSFYIHNSKISQVNKTKFYHIKKYLLNTTKSKNIELIVKNTHFSHRLKEHFITHITKIFVNYIIKFIV